MRVRVRVYVCKVLGCILVFELSEQKEKKGKEKKTKENKNKSVGERKK